MSAQAPVVPPRDGPPAHPCCPASTLVSERSRRPPAVGICPWCGWPVGRISWLAGSSRLIQVASF